MQAGRFSSTSSERPLGGFMPLDPRRIHGACWVTSVTPGGHSSEAGVWSVGHRGAQHRGGKCFVGGLLEFLEKEETKPTTTRVDYTLRVNASCRDSSPPGPPVLGQLVKNACQLGEQSMGGSVTSCQLKSMTKIAPPSGSPLPERKPLRDNGQGQLQLEYFLRN
jgi:hypothetical protein